MADQPMTLTQFGQAIKAKYHDYASVPDEELATRMLEKYPEYQDRVMVAPMNRAIANGAPVKESAMSKVVKGAASAKNDLLVGAAKGAAGTALRAGRVAAYFTEPIGNAIGGAVASRLYGPEAVAQPYSAQPLLREAQRQMEASNTAQSVGKFAEQIGETLIPAGAIEKAGAELAAKVGPKLAPVVGQWLSQFIPKAAVEGASMAGMTAAQGGNPLVGGVLGAAGAAIPRAIVGPNLSRPLSEVDQGALALAAREGVPVDTATKLGSEFLARQETNLASRPGAAAVAEKFRNEQVAALQKVARNLADQAGTGPASPAGAGAGVVKALEQQVGEYTQAADAFYGANRALELDPANRVRVALADGTTRVMGLPINISGVSKDLKGVVQGLEQAVEVAGGLPANGQNALVTLRHLVNKSPSFAPLSAVDEALSGLKAMARGARLPGLRDQDQRLAAVAVSKLEDALQTGIQQLSPAVRDQITANLSAGRAATKAKWNVAEVLDQLPQNPVEVFDLLTRQKDRLANLRRALAQMAPAELEQVGRAWVEDAVQTMTQDGGISGAQRLLSQWRALGPDTKSLLFASKPGLVKDLDNFFVLAQRLTKDWNPSGTAKVDNAIPRSLVDVLAYVPARLLAQTLFSDKGVTLLSGMRLGLEKSKPAQTAAINLVSRALGPMVSETSGR